VFIENFVSILARALLPESGYMKRKEKKELSGMEEEKKRVTYMCSSLRPLR
jgi:hypothetical protein